MRVKLLILYVLLTASLPASAFPVIVSNPQERLRQIFQSENKFAKEAIQSGYCWYIEYILTTEVVRGEQKDIKTVITSGGLYASRDTRYIKTDRVETLLNGRDAFTIYKADKTIMHTLSSPKALLSNNVYGELLRDSIFKNYTIKSCTQRNELSPIVFELVGDGRSRYKKLMINVDGATGSLKEMSGEFNSAYSNDFKSFSLVIKARGRKEPDPSWVDIKSKFLLSNGRLKSPYEAYRYLDLSTKASKTKNTHKR